MVLESLQIKREIVIEKQIIYRISTADERNGAVWNISVWEICLNHICIL
jgi:hypothetical protein